MAAQDRTQSVDLKPATLAELFEAEPYRFEFFQAVRLLERLNSGRSAVGGYGSPGSEVVRFAVHPTITFPASQIQGFPLTNSMAF